MHTRRRSPLCPHLGVLPIRKKLNSHTQRSWALKEDPPRWPSGGHVRAVISTYTLSVTCFKGTANEKPFCRAPGDKGTKKWRKRQSVCALLCLCHLLISLYEPALYDPRGFTLGIYLIMQLGGKTLCFSQQKCAWIFFFLALLPVPLPPPPNPAQRSYMLWHSPVLEIWSCAQLHPWHGCPLWIRSREPWETLFLGNLLTKSSTS